MNIIIQKLLKIGGGYDKDWKWGPFEYNLPLGFILFTTIIIWKLHDFIKTLNNTWNQLVFKADNFSFISDWFCTLLFVKKNFSLTDT